MANRTMQQKRMKMRRERRAWAKPYSRPSGIIPNKGVLKEYKERAAGLGISEYEQDLLVQKHYKRDPIASVPAGESKEVKAALRRLKEQLPEMQFFNILDNSSYRLRCYFNSDKTCYVLVFKNKEKNIEYRSIEYASRQRVMYVWEKNKVTWISTKRLG